MRPTVRKEEAMPDVMYGVCVGAEGSKMVAINKKELANIG